MEVHHHSRHPKKWKEYITEFVMLFAAVTLGFLAENVREEQIIKHQTSSVLSQLRQELMMDTATLVNMKVTHSKLDTAAELISYMILEGKLKENMENFFLLNGYFSYRSGIFETNCIALDQLKYAGMLKNIKQKDVRLAIENYSLSLKNLEGRAIREQEFMNKYIDELRTAAFDHYKAYDSNRVNFNLVKGKTVTQATINCNGVSFKINLVKTFVPEKLTLKVFDQRDYLNKILHLNSIRNSTQDRQYDLAYTRAIDLIKAVEKYYPEVLEEDH